ncbi:hypothetical protein UCRNP2_7136 [Neofusicoccum parvum UCRNP2]|uniref:Uncharacterized protein n=2 Tax=Neofusicoccum parvum TaxID=310453 RepID=R1EF69_BOTPV|nr:hypothetical protein UCRNP2_7136 [Neofusicoccum parvum UCRNP2]GME38436.1 uncharacterized protein LTHEOB_2683 [Neofusicoccum parvum]
MPSNAAQQNIWKQMNYTPPRGPCNHKESLLSPKCPCLRFMLHPLKLTSSFTCDGCNHHASFHSMSSAADDAVLARWESTTTADTASSAAAPAPGRSSRKRPRRALLEAGPSTTNAHAGGGDGGSVFDGNGTLFSEDVGFGGEELAGGGRRDGSKTWGDRFSSWSFGRAEEPVKTPPKRQQQQGVQQQRRRRREQESEMEVRSEVVDLE